MRKAFYLDALEEATNILPEEIRELARHKCFYNPRLEAVNAIKKMAREEELLFHSECAEVLNWKEENAKDTDDSSTVSETQGEENRRECTGSDH